MRGSELLAPRGRRHIGLVLSLTPGDVVLAAHPGHLRAVSSSPAHPDEFALGRGEERVLLFACTHFGRFTPMLRRTPRTVSRARLNGFDFADPSRLRLEEPCPDLNRPLTSHVIATARALRLQPKSSLATRTVLRRPECFTAATRSVCDPLGKERTATTPGRLLPYRARCLATPLKPECGFDPANRASRVRSPRPLSPPPHRRGERFLRG